MQDTITILYKNNSSEFHFKANGRQMQNTITILYHRNCQDGTMAGFLLWNYLRHSQPDSFIDCIDVTYGEDPPDIRDSNIYIVDFCYDKENIMKLLQNNKTLSVLDHHESAANIYGGYGIHTVNAAGKTAMIHLQLELSGCQLVLNFIKQCFKAEACEDSQYDKCINDRLDTVVRHIGQRDRWIFESDDTMIYYEMLKAIKFDDFETYYKILFEETEEEFNKRFEVAKNYYDIKENLAQKFSNLFSLINFCGYKDIPIVNVPSDFNSRVGEILYKRGFPFAIMFCLNNKKVYFSLRSDKESNVNVEEICKKYGGGGHINAAGFVTTPDELIKIFNNQHK